MIQVLDSGSVIQVLDLNDSINVSDSSALITISDGLIGIQGAPGDDGASELIGIAGEDISALRVVRKNPATGLIEYADKDSITDVSTVVGISKTSAVNGLSLIIQYAGELVDPGWNWPTNGNLELFLGSNGALVTTAPVVGYCLRIASISGATKININISEPILRG
jgi:hypothetical protein